MDFVTNPASNIAWLAQQLPQKPETHWVEQAGHFAFLTMPCREEFEREDPQEYAMICKDPEGFDRNQFHRDMHQEMIRFYRSSLGL